MQPTARSPAMTHPVAPGIILVVAVVSLFLTIMGLRAWRRAQDARLLFVTSAFGLFTLKNLITGWSIWQEVRGEPALIGHTDLELMGSVFDLAVVVLLAAPLLLRRR